MDNSFFELILDDLLLRTNKSRRLFLTLILSTILLIGIGLTSVDLFSSKDLNSTNSIINDPNIQFELRKNEVQFREFLIAEKENFGSDINFELLDSISKNQADSKMIRRYLLINYLKNKVKTFEFETEVNKLTGLSPLVEFSDIKTTYEIDYEILESIIEASENKT